MRAVALDVLGVHADDFYGAVVADPRVRERFVNGFIGVLQVDVLADDGDFHLPAFRGDEPADYGVPRRHVAFGRVDSELVHDEPVHPLFGEHQREFIYGMLHIHLLNHRFLLYVAEERKLLAHIVGHGLFGAADEYVGLYADFAQLRNALLRGFCFELARGFQVRKQRDVYEERVFPPDFERELAQRFQKRQPLDVADGSADFRDENVHAFARGV